MDTNDAVFLGDHDYSIASEANAYAIRLSQVVVHPQYNRNTLENDIALLKLSSKITWPSDNTVAPVCLPPAGESFSDASAIVTGWGAQSESGGYLPQLYEVTVSTLTNEECNTLYGGGISDGMICAGEQGKDSCQGDSGGPMISDDNGRYFEIGIVSWGIGCARPNYPGVYTRVNSMRESICTLPCVDRLLHQLLSDLPTLKAPAPWPPLIAGILLLLRPLQPVNHYIVCLAFTREIVFVSPRHLDITEGVLRVNDEQERT
ncbi:trypsin-1-like [Penaeus chinensis]|uniref:trypsin-1-like n=1 Tax=Penaeus chinensis TaxID=139456 RepID=UPI001FB7921A|nr:trypsin-1-like [Penaeus chinensis]